MKKVLSIMLSVVLIATTFIGCSNSTTSGKIGSKYELAGTPYELFNEPERRIWYYGTSLVSKGNGPSMIVVFENGKATYYNHLYNGNGERLNFGKIAQLTDDEIISIVKEREAEYYASDERYVSNPSKYNFEAKDFNLHIYTDGTGNTTNYERLNLEDVCSGDRPKEVDLYGQHYEMFTVYDANFAGFITDDDWAFITKVDTVLYEDINLTLDQPGSENILID